MELNQLTLLIRTHRGMMQESLAGEPKGREILAIGAVLHSFYMGIENIFRRIAIELDRGLPTGPSWHIELLDSMAKANPRRGSVISEELRIDLYDYLSFRHTFRNIYTFQIKWDKMKNLVENLEKTFKRFEKEIRKSMLGEK